MSLWACADAVLVYCILFEFLYGLGWQKEQKKKLQKKSRAKSKYKQINNTEKTCIRFKMKWSYAKMYI